MIKTNREDVMLQLVRWGVVACAMLGAALSAQAQNYPDRPIRLIVAFVPGGATDTLARQISNDLGDALGQSIVIENKPGANGYIAWNFVAASDPDGYTLLLAENALGISQALYKKTQSPFDPLKQYDAIAGLATSPSVLVVSNNVPVNNVAELVALAKSTPQKMNFASAGSAASRICHLKCSGWAPDSKPSMCPTKAAARRSTM
jgi:tripartite-type tricarboxylate transporter receptor subunit TctC